MHEMQKAIHALSEALDERNSDRKKIEDKTLWTLIEHHVGERFVCDVPSDESMGRVREAGGLLTVDASYHRIGGAAPHFIEVYKGVGLSTNQKDDAIERIHVHTPVLEETQEVEFTMHSERSREAEQRLAAIELEVAIALLEDTEGYALVMDGSLIRFAILCPVEWEKLRALCHEKKIPLLGVIEDIKTKHIGTAAKEQGLCDHVHYDREFLMGKLKKGEGVLLHQDLPGKSEQGFTTLFARLSSEPFVIGIDIDGADVTQLKELTAILYAITPKRGRGMPYILDWVDARAKFTEQQLMPYFKKYGNPELFHTYFVAQRDKRR